MDNKIIRLLKHTSRYAQMLHRCYNTECKAYKSYGAKGITVCDEWLDSMDTFIEWCENNGYKEGLVLDKDILCDKLGISPKIYSPNTCQFITSQENQEYSCASVLRQPVASYNNKGELVASYKSISEAGSSSEATNISRAVRGVRLTTKGLYWRYVDSLDTVPLTITIPKQTPRGVPIKEVDFNGNTLGVYDSCSDASRKLGLIATSIAQVVNRERNSVYGRFFSKLNG